MSYNSVADNTVLSSFV